MMTPYEANLIAKLLEDRATECNRYALDCVDAPLVQHYWSNQKDIASDLAIKYREVGKA